MEVIANSTAVELERRGIETLLITTQPKAADGSDRVRQVASWHEAGAKIGRADLVIMFGPIIKPLLYACVLRRPTIVSNQIAPLRSDGLKAKLTQRLTRGVVEVACSESLAASLGRPNVSVVPNPLRGDLAISLNGQRRAPSILFCGRLIPEKGVDLLLDAFAKLARQRSDVTLTIVGEGAEKERLVLKAGALGFPHRVRFAGSLEGAALQAEYRTHSVLAVPSLWAEPFGIVALEGLASGCRVVVTNRGGLPEAVGPHAIVVEPTPESLADGLSSGLSDAEWPRSPSAKRGVRVHLECRRSEHFVSKLLNLAVQHWPSLGPKIGAL